MVMGGVASAVLGSGEEGQYLNISLGMVIVSGPGLSFGPGLGFCILFFCFYCLFGMFWLGLVIRPFCARVWCR